MDSVKFAHEKLERIVGQYPQESIAGPLLLVSGGIHGNEPSGIVAIQEVLDELAQSHNWRQGNIIGISGNLAALKKGQRYVHRDLNRMFLDLYQLPKGLLHPAVHEAEEREALRQVVEGLEKKVSAQELLYFLDLHTTSSNTIPYISVNKRQQNVQFATRFSLPVVMGIEQFIPGHFDHFLTERGHVGFTLEGGKHDDPNAVTLHKQVIYAALKMCGMMEGEGGEENEKLLDDSAGSFYEVVYRFGMKDASQFKMEEGFRNFTPIQKGDLLAQYEGKPVYSPVSGRIFLPLYQSSGEDGFFIVQDVAMT